MVTKSKVMPDRVSVEIRVGGATIVWNSVKSVNSTVRIRTVQVGLGWCRVLWRFLVGLL